MISISGQNRGSLQDFFDWMSNPNRIENIPDAQLADEFTHICGWCKMPLHTDIVDFERHAIMHASDVGITQQMARSWKRGGGCSSWEDRTDDRHDHVIQREDIVSPTYSSSPALVVYLEDGGTIEF